MVMCGVILVVEVAVAVGPNDRVRHSAAILAL